jgi:hypothetical protein
MAEDIFIHSYSEASGRFAILDDNGKVAFLYLTKSGSQQPEKDAIAYMRNAPPKNADWREMAKAGESPLLSHDFATVDAVIPDALASEFSFRWSSDGKSVALIYKGSPIALVSASEKCGYSKAVSKANALADP